MKTHTGRRLAQRKPLPVAAPMVLLRDFIAHALYARSGGYFSKHVVGGLSRAIDFSSLADEREYRQQVASVAVAAASQGSAWLTPAEVFTPHYGRAIAQSIVARHRSLYAGEPLQILEVGGGNGTFAVDVLSYLRESEPELFSSCRYIMLEISERLAEIQRTNVADFCSDTTRVEVHQQCARRWAEDRGTDSSRRLQGPWHIAMLEVADNLPHDKLRVTQPAHDGEGCLLEQAVVSKEERSHGSSTSVRYSESFEPLRDRDLIEVVQLLGLDSTEAVRSLQSELAAAEGAGAGASIAMGVQGLLDGWLAAGSTDVAHVYIPTGCHQLLRALCRACPEHHFTIADFSWLPPQADGAVLAPVVQTQRAGNTIDLRGDYLIQAGGADILFPTHFGQLARLIEAASVAALTGTSNDQRPASRICASHTSTATFMQRWHCASLTATRGGYNPIFDDFSNTRILSTSADASLHER